MGDAVEQLAHVSEVDDGYADLADLALGQDVIGVVPRLGGEVEGDRQAGLPLGQVGPVEHVAGLGRGVPGVGADHPWTIGLIQVRHHADMIPSDRHQVQIAGRGSSTASARQSR